MSLTTRAISALTNTLTSLQNGDWLMVDRAGVANRITFQNVTAAVFGGLTKTGVDANVVTGTAGADGDVATWNADGDVVGGSRLGMEFIESQDASASAQLDFTNFDATKYDAYVFIVSHMLPGVDNGSLGLQMSTDGGSSFAGGASDYRFSWSRVAGGPPSGSATPAAVTDDTMTHIQMTTGAGTAAGEDGVNGVVRIISPHTNRKTTATFELAYTDDTGAFCSAVGAGQRNAAGIVNAVRFSFIGTTIASGTITMYGLRNA